LGGATKRISKMRIGKSPPRASSLTAAHFRDGDDCDAAAVISATPEASNQVEENQPGYRGAAGSSRWLSLQTHRS
jgi:hypothetical protein